MALGVCLLGGSLILVRTAVYRTPSTNVRWDAFLGAYFLALAAVAAVGLSTRGTRVAALGALSGGAAATGFISILSIGVVVILAAVPLWVVTFQVTRNPREESIAVLCGGLAFVALLLGLFTLYHG